MTKTLPAMLAAVGAATIAALTYADASPAAAQDIKIGSFLSVTGPASFLGDPEDKTLRHYVDAINAKGGVIGRRLRLVTYDDGGDANKARTFAKRLIEDDKVDLIIGGSTTGTTMAVVPLVEQDGVPFISLAGAVVIVEPVKKWVFKTPHTDRMACEKIFADLKARGLTAIGLIAGTGGFGKSMRDQCTASAGAHGIRIVAEESYGPRDTDMTAQLTKLKNANGIQAVLNADFGQGPAIVTRNFRQIGLTVPLYQSHGVASKQFIELAGAAANGVRLPASALLVAGKLPANDPQKPVVTAYKAAYEDAFKSEVSTFGGHAYDALFIAVAAIERAGSTDKAKVRDQIEATRGFMGTAGMVNMSASDHLGLDLSAFRMLEIRDGDWALAE